MSSCLISKLKTLIREGGSKDEIEKIKDAIAEEIEENVKEESFYELPTNEILEIIGKCEIENLELLCGAISRMRTKKGKESTLLLNVIKREEATLDECIIILSMFKHSQLCKRTSELFNEEKKLPERDFENENEELRKENAKLKMPMKTFFPPVTEEPRSFESDIFKAAEKGKLTSVQYLVEQCHANVEAKDKIGNTPINCIFSLFSPRNE